MYILLCYALFYILIYEPVSIAMTTPRSWLRVSKSSGLSGDRVNWEEDSWVWDRLSRSSYCYPTEVLLRFCRADTSHFKLLWFRGLHNKKSPKSGASILQRGHQVCCGLKEATHGSHKLPRHELNIHHSGWGIYGFISHQIAATLKKFSNHVWRYYWTRRCHHYTVYSTFKPPSF